MLHDIDSKRFLRFYCATPSHGVRGSGPKVEQGFRVPGPKWSKGFPKKNICMSPLPSNHHPTCPNQWSRCLLSILLTCGCLVGQGLTWVAVPWNVVKEGECGRCRYIEGGPKVDCKLPCPSVTLAICGRLWHERLQSTHQQPSQLDAPPGLSPPQFDLLFALLWSLSSSSRPVASTSRSYSCCRW